VVIKRGGIKRKLTAWETLRQSKQDDWLEESSHRQSH